MFQFPIEPLAAEWRCECARIEEQVDVFREPVDQPPTLRKAGTAFEDDMVASDRSDVAQRLGDVVVLLDDGRPQAAHLVMVRSPLDGLIEVRVLAEPHAAPLALACHTLAVGRSAKAPKSNRDRGFKD